MVFKRVKDFVAGRANKKLEVLGDSAESPNPGNNSASVAVMFTSHFPSLSRPSSPASPSPISSDSSTNGQGIAHTPSPVRGIIGSGVGFGARIKAQNDQDENANKKALVPVPAGGKQGTAPKTPLQVSKTRPPLGEKNLNTSVTVTTKIPNIDQINEIELLSVLNDAYHDPSTLDILREHKFGLSTSSSLAPHLGPNPNRTKVGSRPPFPSRAAIQSQNGNRNDKENDFPPHASIQTKNKNAKGKDENKGLRRVYITNRIVLGSPATPTPAPTGSTVTSRSYTLPYPYPYPLVRSYTQSQSQSQSRPQSQSTSSGSTEVAGPNEVVAASIQEAQITDVGNEDKTNTRDSIRAADVNESKSILECGLAAAGDDDEIAVTANGAGDVDLGSKAATSVARATKVEQKDASPTTTTTTTTPLLATFKDRLMTGELAKAITIIKGNANANANATSSSSSLGIMKSHALKAKLKARSKVKIKSTSKDKLNLKAKSKGKPKAKGKEKRKEKGNAKKGDGLGEEFGSPLSFKCRGLDVRSSNGSSFEWLDFAVLGSDEGIGAVAGLPVPVVGDSAGVCGERKEGDGPTMDDNDGSAKPEVSSSPTSALPSPLMDDDAINQLHNAHGLALPRSARRTGHGSMSNTFGLSVLGMEIVSDRGHANVLGDIEEAEEDIVNSEGWVEVVPANVGDNVCKVDIGEVENRAGDSQTQEGNNANVSLDPCPGTSTEGQYRLSAQPNQDELDGHCHLGLIVNDKVDSEADEGPEAAGVPATSSALSVLQPEPPNVANSPEDVSPAAHSADSIPRTMKLQDLHFVRQLGKGASGRVYFVKDTISRCSFALKVIKKDGLDGADPEVLRLLFSEQKILRENEGNPWLLQLEASWTDSLSYYMVMPFHPISLEDIIWDEIRISAHRARFYLVELIIAIESLHARGIIHRDIKPGNVLISTSGHVVLADFGFSNDFHRRPSASEITHQPYWPHLPGTVVTEDTPPVDPEDLIFVTNTRCGSPYEAAPEVYIGDWYSFPIDYWAAGVTLFWMLTGHPPWFEEDDDELCDQILFDPPVYLPEDLVDPIDREFIDHMLQKDPKDRLGIGREMKSHPYFSGVDWELHEARRVPVPWTPPPRVWEVPRPYNENISGAVFEPGNPVEAREPNNERFFDFHSDRVKFGKTAPETHIYRLDEGNGSDGKADECVKTSKRCESLRDGNGGKRDSLLGKQGDAGGEDINGGVECGRHEGENIPGTTVRASDEMFELIEEMVASIGYCRTRKQSGSTGYGTRIREQHERSACNGAQCQLRCQSQPCHTLSPSFAESCPSVLRTPSHPEGQAHEFDPEPRDRRGHRRLTYNFASWSSSKFNTTKPLVILKKVTTVQGSLRCLPPPELAVKQPIKQSWYDLVMEDETRMESTHQPSNHLELATHDGRKGADVAFGSVDGSATLNLSPQVTPIIAGVVSPPRPLANAIEVSRMPTTIDARVNVSTPNDVTDPFTMLYPKTTTSTSPRTLKTTIKQISPLSTIISFAPLLFQSPRKNAMQDSIIEEVSPSHSCNAKIDPTTRQETVAQNRANVDTHSPRNAKVHLNNAEMFGDSERRRTATRRATPDIEIQFPTRESTKTPEFLNSRTILEEEASICRYTNGPPQRHESPDSHTKPPSLCIQTSNDFGSQRINTNYAPHQLALGKEAERGLVQSRIPSSSKFSDAGTRVEDSCSCNSSDSEGTRYSPRSDDPRFYGKFKEIFGFCDTPSASPSLLVSLSLALLDPPTPKLPKHIPHSSDISLDSPLMRPLTPFCTRQDSPGSPYPPPPLVAAAWEDTSDENDYEFVEIPEDTDALSIFSGENIAPCSPLSSHPSGTMQLSNSDRDKHNPTVSPNKMAEKVKAWGKKVLSRSRGNSPY